MKKRILWLLADVLAAAVILLGIWIVDYKLPQKGVKAVETVDIYPPGEVDVQQLIQKGAYQSWIFGPSLLDDNGKAKTSFITWDYIRQSHPRTALGYYEPGHYCLLLVDGRQSDTRGMFLDEMAKVFEDLGCKKAYNLDGGHCSFMTFNGTTANHPYIPINRSMRSRMGFLLQSRSKKAKEELQWSG